MGELSCADIQHNHSTEQKHLTMQFSGYERDQISLEYIALLSN